MATKIISIIDQRATSRVPVIPAHTPAPGGTLADTRARLSTDGKLYTCLFATHGLDLRTPLRAGADDAALTELIRNAWLGRGDRYSEIRAEVHASGAEHKIEMYYIGG